MGVWSLGLPRTEIDNFEIGDLLLASHRREKEVSRMGDEMTDKDRIEAYSKLSEQMYKQYNDRRELEWWIHVAIWTFLVAIGYLVVTQHVPEVISNGRPEPASAATRPMLPTSPSLDGAM